MTLVYEPEGLSPLAAPYLVSRAVIHAACLAARRRKVGLLCLDRTGEWVSKTLWEVVGRKAAARRNLILRQALRHLNGEWRPELRKLIVDQKLSHLWIDSLSALHSGSSSKAAEISALEELRRAIRGLKVQVYAVYPRGRLYAELLREAEAVDDAVPAECPALTSRGRDEAAD